jgi:hypothetical protein
VEDREKTVELEVARRVDEGKGKIREEVSAQMTEEYRLKERAHEEQIKGLQNQIEALKRKAEQGSQQLQGEVLEVELEDNLAGAFPFDRIEPVAKGVRGADVLQHVRNNLGQDCGTLIWETKRTKAWNDGWIPKLKEDQREAKADVAILVATTLPKGVANFERINGVWVTNFACVLGLATALRINLMQVSGARLAAVGRSEKMEVLYTYLTGSEFRHRVEAIVESFVSMRADLERERAAVAKIWAKREKQIGQVLTNIAGMTGDIEGIAGSSLPPIPGLELKALTDGSELLPAGGEEPEGSSS